MKRIGQLAFLGISAACLALACSSSNVIGSISGEDDPDATPTPSPPSGDASAADAAPPGVSLASRLEVSCTEEPCYVAVSGSGGGHTCALLADGTVRCWGRDTRIQPTAPEGDAEAPVADGALGRGRIVSRVEAATPAPVVGLTNVKQISVGRGLGTCALTKDGSVYCWGRNEYGQLGQPKTDASVPAPKRVEGLPPASAIALGGAVGCAIAAEGGALWCWGSRNLRTTWLTTTTTGPIETFGPQLMSEFGAPVREVAVGSSVKETTSNAEPDYNDTIMALRADGVLASHGRYPAVDTASLPWMPAPTTLAGVARLGTFAYLGPDGLVTRWFPERRPLHAAGAPKVVDVVIAPDLNERASVEQGGLLLGDGRLYRWGRNTGGELGYPLELLEFAADPLEMTHVVGNRVVSFAMTHGSTCVSLVDGKVKCWGSNFYGELGRGTTDGVRHPEAELIR
jgi:Regulator of chromosome condensation (RCC1) repeat